MSKAFEESLFELKLLVNKLEQGDLLLEEALSSFQEGLKLSINLSDTLQKAYDTFNKMINEQGEEILLLIEAMLQTFVKQKKILKTLQGSLLYSLMTGGKRLRPLLTLMVIELIHRYSLIHNDLLAMDNDDLRILLF